MTSDWYRAVASRVSSAGAEFWRWWSGELASLLPHRWSMGSRARIEARVLDGAIEISLVRSSKPARLAILRGDKLQPEGPLRVLCAEKSKLPVWLFPPAAAILSRMIQIPRSAAASFDKLLLLEADRWTPYRADEIVAAWRELPNKQETKADIELRFVPHSALETWQQSLAAVGLAASVAVLDSGGDLYAPLHGYSSLDGKSIWRRRAAIIALVSASITFLLSDWIAAVHEREAWQRRVEHERQAYATQKTLEKKIADLLSASREQSDSITRFSRNSFLASTAELLPSTDWLTEVAIRKNVATLRGYSVKPELLLKAFEPLATGGEIALQGDLTFDAKTQQQRFTISFRTGGSHE